MMAPCFFALYPDDPTSAMIERQQEEHCRRLGLPRRALRPRNVFHVSIAEWGKERRLREPYETALHKAKERFCFPAFAVALVSTARMNASDGGWSLVFESDAETARHIHALRNALADVQQEQGLIAARSAIRPHLTVAYGSDIPDEKVAIEPICFRAKQVDMVVSNFGKSEHIHVDHWALKEATDP